MKFIRICSAAVCAASVMSSAFAVEYTLIPYSSAMTATGTSQYDAGRGLVHAIDGSGLSTKDGVLVHTDSYNGNMWMTTSVTLSSSAPKFYCVDLGATYHLGQIKIWNYNQSGQQARGFKATEIYVTDNVKADKSSVAKIRAWGAPVWTGELSKAKGANDPGCSPISFAWKSARYVAFVVTSSHGDAAYQGLSEVRFFSVPEGMPAFESSSVELNANKNGFIAKATLAAGSHDSELAALAYASSDAEPTRVSLGVAKAGEEKSQALEGLAASATYAVRFEATNDVDTVTNGVTEAAYIYTGMPTLTWKADGQERGSVPAEVTVSLASADPYPLEVHYSLSSVDGKEGVDYEPASGVITIPANAASAVITVTPIPNSEKDEDVHVTVTLEEANNYYKTGTVSADVTLANVSIPSDANVWIAGASSDGLASTAANWSKGVPRASVPESLVIIVEGCFSTHDLIWNADGTTELASSITSWTQAADYTGTVRIDTTYDGPFTALNVSGDVKILAGTWTHRANSDAETYRLKVLAGGDVTIASAAKIDAAGKGFATNKARPGSALGCHASPAGSAGVDKLYGDMKKPEALGSGNAKGAGGGAVYIEAAGAFSNEGAISVASTGGASGSIYIKAVSVSGSGTYNARTPISINNNPYQAGSGGRIAFELTSASTITDNEDVFINGKCSAGFSLNGRNSAAGGTIFVKSPTRANGVLYVSGQSGANYSYVRLQPEFGNMLAIPANESWTLDGIVFLNSPIAGLRVPTGTTLSLPGGLASVKAYGNGGGIGGSGGGIATGNRGLVVDGGSLVLPSVAEHLIANNWTLQANKPYTLSGNVRVNAGGRIGVVAGYGTNYAYTNRCDLTVTGDLMIESKGSIDANGAGWKNYADKIPAGMGFYAVQQHGAHGGVSKNLSDAAKYAYDSILNPTLPGTGAQSGDAGTAEFGGGCVILTVGGKLTLAGNVIAKSVYQDVNGGGGGTINITCGSIEGAGTIDVTTQTGYGGTQGGGGRVAIRLTDANADFANYPLSRIAVAQSGDQSSGGTIYLQTAANGENGGTVYIKGNTSNTATVRTPFPALHGGGEKDVFSNASLAITSNGKALLSANAKVRELSMVSGTLDLNGKTLKVSRAFMNGTRLAEGTYTAASAEVKDYVTDSGTGGKLIVGSGFMIIVR